LQEETEVRTGFAEGAITDCGEPSADVRDDPCAGVLWLEDSGGPAALIALDLCNYYGARLVEEVKSAVERTTGAPPGRVSMTLSHTHTPARPDPGRLAERVAQIAARARDAAAPAAMGFARVRVDGLCVNRRIVVDEDFGALSIMTPLHAEVDLESGVEDVRQVVVDFITYGPNLHHPEWFHEGGFPESGPDAPSPEARRRIQDLPGRMLLDGPVDPELDVVSFARADGSLLGTLLRFCCHPAIMHSSYGTRPACVSADFPGALRREVSAATGAPTLFTQGAGANIKPLVRFTGDMADEAARVGHRLAAAALGAIAGLRHEPLRRLDVVRADTVFEVAPFKLAGGAEPLETARVRFERMRSEPYDPRSLRRELDAVLRAWAGEWHLDGPEVTLPLGVIGLGDVAIATMPGEIFVEHGLELKKRFADRMVLPIELTDSDAPDYVPTREAFSQGGYEVAVAALAPGSGERMVEVLSELLEGCFGRPGAPK